MRTKKSRLRWWLAPITFAFGSLLLDATIVATDYVARGRIASAAPDSNAEPGAPASPASMGRSMDLAEPPVVRDTLVRRPWSQGKECARAPDTRMGELLDVRTDSGVACGSP